MMRLLAPFFALILGASAHAGGKTTRNLDLTYYLGVLKCPATTIYCGHYENPDYSQRHRAVSLSCDDWVGCQGFFKDEVTVEGVTYIVDGDVRIYAEPNSYLAIIGKIYEKGNIPDVPSFNFMSRNPEQLGELVFWGTPSVKDTPNGKLALTPTFSVGELKF